MAPTFFKKSWMRSASSARKMCHRAPGRLPASQSRSFSSASMPSSSACRSRSVGKGLLRGGSGWGDPLRAPTLPCRAVSRSGSHAAACTRMLMESVASTVRFLVPMVRSWGCTPGSGSGGVGERRASSWVGGTQLTPPPRAPRSCRVALTVSHADTRAQPAPASLAPQVGSQVEVAGGPAVLRQRQAGTQVGGPAAQARCLRPAHRLPVLAKPPRCPQP